MILKTVMQRIVLQERTLTKPRRAELSPWDTGFYLFVWLVGFYLLRGKYYLTLKSLDSAEMFKSMDLPEDPNLVSNIHVTITCHHSSSGRFSILF